MIVVPVVAGLTKAENRPRLEMEGMAPAARTDNAPNQTGTLSGHVAGDILAVPNRSDRPDYRSFCGATRARGLHHVRVAAATMILFFHYRPLSELVGDRSVGIIGLSICR